MKTPLKLAALTALLLPMAAAQSDIDPNGKATFVTTAEPTFNPWSPNSFVESNLLNELLFPGLTRWDKNLRPSPDLATSWKASNDGMKWTFNLRRGVKWHDGKPFTAQDVAFTFNDIVLNKELGANQSSEWRNSVEKVNVVNPYTVEFVLKKPWASLPTYLGYYSGILPKHKFEGVKDPWKFVEFNKQNPVGTGPFKVVRVSSGASVRLERNDAYWGGKPKLKEIEFKIIPDSNAQLAQLLSGDVDLISVANPETLDRLKSNPNLVVDLQTQNLYYWISLNQEDPRFRDVKVRQALLYALDRPAMIKSVLRGYAQPATGPIAPIQKNFYTNKVSQYPFDPARAKKLLAEAGWKPGPDGVLQKDGKPFVIEMPTAQYQQLLPITLLIQQYWKNIGVKAELKTMDWNSYIQQVVVKRDYQGTVNWWSTPADPDVLPYYASSSAGTGYNIPGYKNPALDRLLEEGRRATSTSARKKVYTEAQELMAKELPYLYLWYPQMIIVKNKRLQGMRGVTQAADFQYAHEWYVTRK
ncbi:peptide/nickel transport system substrate-binding protein [Deinobacterium chartae]|uniref:Peptide/nickel transport system substrate-binding protein n=1 Tax=Deinobacterium chartae TaxID=521158 RepID=A0A841I2L8_9DEIO|nr:ABC transporter substrate-binding protein [Deinobacterium chartae]MBB6098588.1 peptide/nickel transport system substrate-binding protein [Deinobacterium chartae]